jgi:hypothetical protein
MLTGTEIFPGIVIYDNVIDNSNILKEKLLNNFNKKPWHLDEWPDFKNPGNLSRSYYEYQLYDKDKFGKEILEIINPTKALLQEYCKHYDVELWDHDRDRAMIYEPGCFFGQHKDDTLKVYRRVSTVYYVNDDYDGGEITFPYINITIKPKANQFLIFPSSYLFMHSVSKVEKFRRLAIVGFAQ